MNTNYKNYDLDSAPAKSYGKDEWMTSVHINKLSSDGYKTKILITKLNFSYSCRESSASFVRGEPL